MIGNLTTLAIVKLMSRPKKTIQKKSPMTPSWIQIPKIQTSVKKDTKPPIYTAKAIIHAQICADEAITMEILNSKLFMKIV